LNNNSNTNTNTRKLVDLLKTYWGICYRMLNNSHNSNNNNDNDDNNNDTITDIYQKLIDFIDDTNTNTKEFVISNAYQRRLFRVLCDELDLTHYPIINTNNDKNNVKYLIKKMNSITTTSPPSLRDILNNDTMRKPNDRKFDSSISTDLINKIISNNNANAKMISTAVLGSMARACPSPSWALQWVSILVNNNINISSDIFNSIITMSTIRSDPYTVLEMMTIANKTNINNSNGNILNDNDVRNACVAVWKSKHTYISTDSNTNSNIFKEVIDLIKGGGYKVTTDILRVLLQYHSAAVSNNNTNWLGNIFDELYNDKKAPISHIECIALTRLLIKRSKINRSDFGLNRPYYKYENYLYAYPDAVAALRESFLNNFSSLGHDYLNNYDGTWQHIRTAQGRLQFYQFINDMITIERKKLIELSNYDNNENNNNDSNKNNISDSDDVNDNRANSILISNEACQSLSALAIYCAYLIGVQDSNYRLAYDLLYVTHRLTQERGRYI